MTVNELLSAAAALFFETDTSAYGEVALPFVNMLLAECFEANNRILRKSGKEEMTNVPVLTQMSDIIPYGYSPPPDY